ncbi:MAG TPA: FRG domain-containing protein [Candidatus Angelobacter sp.]|nr:FRG domain-containing protein [Candidatus Angelobacter sp.]
MKALQAKSWTDLKGLLQEAKETLDQQADEELWFRGVSSDKHALVPSLLRCKRIEEEPSPEEDQGCETENTNGLETDLFFEFLAKARTGSGAALDHWDALFLMQHYRAPTRLLDWTETLYVALHFAVSYSKSGQKETPRLYIINPYAWNEEHYDDRDLFYPKYFAYEEGESDETNEDGEGSEDQDGYFWEYGEILVSGGVDWKNPVALYPPQRDARLSAQRGYFTIHGFDHRPLDKISPELIVAIDLQPKAVKEIRQELQYSGIDEYSLFPDLEGLSRYLKWKYRIEP